MFFAPETQAATDAVGLKGGWMSYFGCRAAPLGAVSAAAVTSIFYGFHPRRVERAIPEPILNRMNIYEVEAPDFEAARGIALRLYDRIRAGHDWGERFDPQPADPVLDHLATLAPREMRRAWMTAFGNARLDDRCAIELRDLPAPAGKRSPIGFVQ